MKILAELKKEVTEDFTEDFIDNDLHLEKLINKFLTDDYLEGKPLLPMIDETMVSSRVWAAPPPPPHPLKIRSPSSLIWLRPPLDLAF